MSDRRSRDQGSSRRHTQPLGGRAWDDASSDRGSQRLGYRSDFDKRTDVSYGGASHRERILIEKDRSQLPDDLHDAEVVHVITERGRRKSDQRDEIIEQLTDKVREMSGLFATLQSRLLDKEREVELLRSDSSHRQSDHLEDEFREKERLMQQMIDEKSESVDLLKQQHESQIVAQGSLFNQEIDRRDQEIESLQREVSRLQLEKEDQRDRADHIIDDAREEHHSNKLSLMDAICAIFEIRPISSESELLDSLQRIKDYIGSKEDSEDITRNTLTEICAIFDLRAVSSESSLIKALQTVKDYVVDDSFRRERLATVSLLDNICSLFEIHPVKDERELLDALRLVKNATTSKVDNLRLFDSICDCFDLPPVDNELDLLKSLSRVTRSSDSRNIKLFDQITTLLSLPPVHSESELISALKRFVSSPRRTGPDSDKQILVNKICSLFELRPHTITTDSDLLSALSRVNQPTDDSPNIYNLIDSVTDILNIRPVRTEASLLQSLRAFKENQDGDFIDQVCDIFDINKTKKVPVILDDLQSIKQLLRSNNDSAEIQELQNDKHALQDKLDALTKEFSEQCELVGKLGSDHSGTLDALIEHGHADARTTPDRVVAIVNEICTDLRTLTRSMNRQLRHKQEIVSSVLEDPSITNMNWDSESSDDGDDLSDTTSPRNIKWGRTRVRVRSIVDRLCQRDNEVERLYRKLQNQSVAASQATPSDAGMSVTAAPYLGLITETERAPDDTGPGVRLLEVLKYTAAERCGLHFGDRLLSIGSRKVSCSYDLDMVLSELSPGDTVEVLYLRGRSKKKTLLVVGPASDKKRKRKMNKAEIKARVNWTGK